MLWLYQAYGLSVATAGSILFWSGLLSALSFLLAVPISTRFGLVNTMVFTHLPSNIFVILVPFAPNLATAIGTASRKEAQRAGRSKTGSSRPSRPKAHKPDRATAPAATGRKGASKRIYAEQGRKAVDDSTRLPERRRRRLSLRFDGWGEGLIKQEGQGADYPVYPEHHLHGH